VNWQLALATVLPVALSAHQDGVLECNDGDRYTSGKGQPHPFHRRFTHWPKRVLQATNYLSLLGLGYWCGDWKKALLLLTLPGAWFIATHPTVVDGPLMLLALLSAHYAPTNPLLSVSLSLVAGIIHERGPVFAAVYAFHPLPLLGLLGVQWWRKPPARDKDTLVGLGTLAAIKVHRSYQDLLDGKIVLVGLRGLLPLSVYYGTSPRALLAFLVAYGSRLIGTDTCRFLFWAAPPLVSELPDLPAWVILVHVVTFRRAI
jgi:hypothetical protein